jgi:predicted transcriptional regulator
MDNRGLKTRKPLSNAIDKELWDKLDDLAKETKIPKSKLLDMAVELLLKKYGK